MCFSYWKGGFKIKYVNKIVVISISIIVLLVLVVTFFIKASYQNRKNEEFKVRIGHFPNITHAQALVGREEGTFEKALGDEVSIDWKVFNAGPSAIEALFAGELDISYIGPGPAINGYTKSKGDIQIIAGATDAGAIFVSRKDLKITDLKELSGKKIAIPQYGNTQDLSLRNIMKENGLKDATKGGTVEIRQAENADIKTLLGNGQIDAALVPEPWGSRLIKEVGANIILDYKDVWKEGQYSSALIVVRTEFLKEHSEVVENFIKAHVEVTDYINNNLDKSKEIVNKQINTLTKKPLAKDVLDSSFNRLTVTYDPEKESVIDFVKLSQGAGYLKSNPDTKNLFNLEILNKVLREQGKKEIK
jgi:NitT/TauT family transport system substrate-binding protein